MTFPVTVRVVTIFRGKGRRAVAIGQVVVDVGCPDCLNWAKMHKWKLTALVTDGAIGNNNSTGGIKEF